MRRRPTSWDVVLNLYVAGNTPSAETAIELVRGFCDAHLAGRYSLGIIDIHEQPAVARSDQIVAVPTLVKVRPEPVRRFIGNLSNVDVLARRLDLAGFV